MSVKAIKHNNSVNNTVRHLSTCCTCISQTTLTSAVVRNLSPQLWHQFRITAVNIYGSQGPTEPSSPFSLLFGLSKFLRFSLYNKVTNDDCYTKLPTQRRSCLYQIFIHDDDDDDIFIRRSCLYQIFISRRLLYLLPCLLLALMRPAFKTLVVLTLYSSFCLITRF